MGHLNVELMARDALAQLEDTARITSGNYLRLDRSNVGHLSVQEFLGCVGMHEIINTSAAATPVALGYIYKLQLRNLT